MPDILISENITGVAVDSLAARFDVVIKPELWRYPEVLADEITGVRGLIVRNQTKVTRDLLSAGTKLEVIGRAGVGLDNVDVAAAFQAGIIVTSTPDQNAISVAELAIGMMIALARHIPAANIDTKAGHWNRQRFVGTELYGKTFGIIGAGKIGFLTARRAQAFGMKIIAFDPFLSNDNVYLAELNAELIPLECLLERADVVSCHLPATPQTTRLLNARAFARMQPSAIFLNTSRGEVIDENDLFQALRSGVIAGAALDVRAVEPPTDSHLESIPNLLLTPHIAALTQEAQQRVTAAICDDVGRVLKGDRPLNAVRIQQRDFNETVSPLLG